MYNALAFQPSQYGGLHYAGLHYGASPAAGFPCIKLGATNQASRGAVAAVQQELVNAGVVLSLADLEAGFFGPKTDLAVRKFQTDNGFDADGIVGPITGKALGLDFQSCTRTITTTPAPVDPGGGRLSFGERLNVLRLTNPVAFYGVSAAAVLGLVGVAVAVKGRKKTKKQKLQVLRPASPARMLTF